MTIASRESVLSMLLQEEVAKQQITREQFALRLLSSSAIPVTHCQTVGSAVPLSFPSLSALQSKMAASLEIKRQLSQQQQNKQLLLDYQLLVAAQRKKQQQHQSFSLPFMGTVCNGGASKSDLLSPAILQQLTFSAGGSSGSTKRSLEEMAASFQAKKRMRVEKEEKNKLPTLPCRCRGMPDDHNPKVRHSRVGSILL
jgi:hypothetical protein